MSDIAKLGFSVNTAGLIKGEKALDSYAKKGQQTEKRIDKSIKKTNKDFLTLNKTIGIVATSLVALGSVRLTQQLIENADAWKNINSQIRQVTDSEEDLVKVRKQLFAITKDTRSELTNTVNLFAEMKRGTSELAISDERLLGVTRTLNNLFVAGGKPIAETVGAIRQLNQGFASGVLRGDEFNSVAEGAPKVMDALTSSLGKTRGELREFAATGGITAEILITALESYSDTAQGLADQTEKTFGQSLQASSTNLTKFVGESKSLNDIIDSLGETIESLSENLDAGAEAAEAMLVVVGLGLTPAMFTYTTSLVATATAQLTAGTTAIATADAFGFVTTRAATATVATNALGIATKFLLGPWGLLLAAVGTGVAVFSSSESAVSGMTDEIVRQGDEIKNTLSIYDAYIKKLNESKASALSGLGQEELQEEFDKSSALVEKYTRQLEILDERNASAARKNALAEKLALEKSALEEITKLLPNASTSYDRMSKEVQKLIDTLDPASKLLRDFKEQQKLLVDAQALGNISAERAIELNDLLQASYDKSIEKTDKVQESFEAQLGTLVMQNAELALSADAFELYAAEQEAIANGSTPAMIKSITDLIKNNQKLRKEMDLKENAKDLKGLTKAVDNFGGAWSKTGSVIIDTFGDIADSLDNYVDRMEDIGKLEKEIADKREAFGGDNAELTALQMKLDGEKVSAELAGMSALASAGQNLFDEKTAAAKSFAALQKIIAVAEIALSFQKISAGTAETTAHVANETVKAESNALSAITAAFSAPWPIGFVAGAAMIGIMASLLGGSKGGGGGGGGSSQTPEEMEAQRIERIQSSQGTGSRLGSDDKADSIIKVLETLSDVSIDQLSELRGVRNGVSNLSRDISDLTIGIINGGAFGGAAGELVGQIKGIVLESALGLGFETTVFERVTDVRDEGRGFFDTESEFITLTLEEALEEFRDNIGTVSFQGLSGEEIEAELEAIFSQQADLVSELLVPSLTEYQRVGEGLFDTLVRVSNEQAIFNDSIDQMGLSLSGLDNLLKIDIAQSVIQLTGGLEAFNDLSQSFFENFFSDAEQMAFLETSLSEAFDSLGLSLVTSKEEFRGLIEGIDLTTLEGQELLAALLEINPALSDYIDELERLEQERIDRAEDAFSMLERAIDLERERAEAALNTAEIARDLELERIDILRGALNEEHDLRQANLAGAETILNDAFNAEMERVKSGSQARIQAVQDSSNARIQGLNDEKSAINSTANAMRSLTKNINKALGLDGSLDLVSALASARAGDFSKAQSLNVGALTNLKPGEFSSAQEFEIQQSINRNRLATIGTLAGEQLSESDALLSAIDNQIESSKSSSDNQISAINAQANQDVSALQSQLNALLGVGSDVTGGALTIEEAISQFRDAQHELDDLNFDEELARLDMLTESANDVFALHEQGYNDELARLDGIIETNEAILNAALGINNSILSVADAIEALNNSLAIIMSEPELGIGNGTIRPDDPTTPDDPILIPDIPIISQETESSSALSDEAVNELREIRRENEVFMMELIRKSTISANALQQFRYDGIDTRPVTS